MTVRIPITQAEADALLATVDRSAGRWCNDCQEHGSQVTLP